MQTGKITALYVRFSYDDGIDAESGSIEHQKSLLRSYAESNGFTNLSYYADDGYTGTNFNRPDFQRMLGDIQKGLVSTVIVKDMSRLGRNYLMVGQYVEMEFPKHNVRFIAISDNVDSAKGMNDLLPIHNLMNEWYSRDISKKVRAMIRQKGNSGQAIASKLPYGYYNTPEDKQKWLIDESAANVVRKIFDLYLNQSFGMYQIAKILKAEGVPKPTYHRRLAKGIKVEADDLCVWSASVVRGILQHREYIGDTVNFRTEITSYKNKKVIHNSDDKWRIFPNTHPAIIDRETFQKVQDKIAKEIRHTRNVHSYLFADYLYCMDCHSRMHGRQCYLKGKRSLPAYECSTYRKSKGCCFHGVPEMYLQAEVLARIQKVLAFAKSNPAEFRQNIRKALEEQSDGSKAVIQEELDKAQTRTAEIDKYIQGLFEAKVRGEIDGSLFASLKKTYDEEKEQLNRLIIELITKLSRENEANEKVQLLYAAIRKYDAVWELTLEVLTDFIEKIEVGQVSAENKKISFELRDNQISVFFWGVGIIDFI